LIGTCLVVGVVLAQEKPALPRVSRLVPVQHLKGQEFNRVRSMLDAFGASVKGDDSMHMFAVSGPEDMVNAVAEAIKKLDVPPAVPKNIELTFFILLGSSQAGGESAKTPADLEPGVNTSATQMSSEPAPPPPPAQKPAPTPAKPARAAGTAAGAAGAGATSASSAAPNATSAAPAGSHHIPCHEGVSTSKYVDRGGVTNAMAT